MLARVWSQRVVCRAPLLCDLVLKPILFFPLVGAVLLPIFQMRQLRPESLSEFSFVPIPSVSVLSLSAPSSSLGGDVASDGDFLIFEGNRYSRKGFLFKSFAMSAVVSVCCLSGAFFLPQPWAFPGPRMFEPCSLPLLGLSLWPWELADCTVGLRALGIWARGSLRPWEMLLLGTTSACLAQSGQQALTKLVSCA